MRVVCRSEGEHALRVQYYNDSGRRKSLPNGHRRPVADMYYSGLKWVLSCDMQTDEPMSQRRFIGICKPINIYTDKPIHRQIAATINHRTHLYGYAYLDRHTPKSLIKHSYHGIEQQRNLCTCAHRCLQPERRCGEINFHDPARQPPALHNGA